MPLTMRKKKGNVAMQVNTQWGNRTIFRFRFFIILHWHSVNLLYTALHANIRNAQSCFERLELPDVTDAKVVMTTLVGTAGLE